MKFRAEIGTYTGLKKGMKVTLLIPDDEVKNVIGGLDSFIKKPITVEFLVDAKQVLDNMDKITPDQRSKIFALVKDIANQTGEDDPEGIRVQMKNGFMRTTGTEDFSLSNCSKEVATNFIQYLLMIAFELRVPFSQDMRNKYSEDDSFYYACLAKRVCSICGSPYSDIHHWDAIGMGRNRKKYDDSDHRKIALCRTHHTEVETIGRDTFVEKYHVKGVIWNE